MKAAVGDRIVVVSSQVGGTVRDGVVVELRHPDGSPPYLVEWSDSGQRGLYFPGTDGRIEHHGGSMPVGEVGEVGEVVSPHVATWTVTIQLLEQGPATSARAVLHSGAAHELDARGTARRNPADRDVPEIGDEVAVARALHGLADSLLRVAQQDMAAARSLQES